MKGKKYIKLLIVVCLVVLPQLTFGQLLITEIQYNPEGTDGGYEWIELHNSSDQPISIEGFTFRESDQNHRLTQTNEVLGWTIPTGGYAVIADNPTKFYEHYPGHPGLVFDSSFTLVNTGELLEILDTNGELVFGLTYDPAWGGDGDGSTLGVIANVWQATKQTPGYANELFVNSSEGPTETTTETNTQEVELTQTPVENPSEAYIQLSDPEYQEKTIKANGGGDRILLAGVPFEFAGVGYGFTGGELTEGIFSWNFGDGTRDTGSTVIHTYANPGEYVATLRVGAMGYSHTDRFEVTVIAPQLVITASTTAQTISLSNFSAYTIEISDFLIISGDTVFAFPDESYIKARSVITLPVNSLGLAIHDQTKIHLQSPDGNTLDSFSGIATQIENQIQLLEQEVAVLEQSSSTENPNTSELQEQIVYIGVPQYINSEPVPSSDQEIITIATNTQAAQIPNVVKQKLLSPFEWLLLALLLLGAGVASFMHHTKHKQKDGIDIEEL